MPLLKDAQRKADYIDDIGKMISQNTIFTQGKENPNFLKAFNDVGKYFSRQKGEDAQALAAYVQNFINVFNNQKLAGEEKENEYSGKVVTDIESMQSGFKAAYDRFISAKGYSALKNDNVKMLSAMVQTAENMAHRTDMENRKETVDFIDGQIEYESTVLNNSSNEYTSFLKDCEKNGVDFVDTESQLEEQRKKYAEEKIIYDNLKQTLNKITNGQLNKDEDLKAADEYTKQIYAYDKKLHDLQVKTSTILNLKDQLQYFAADSAEANQQIENYKSEIEENKIQLQEKDAYIAEEKIKSDEGKKARERRNEIQESGLILNHGEAQIKYDNVKDTLQAFTEIVNENPNINELLSKQNPNMFESRCIDDYNNAKKTIIDLNPEMEQKIALLEQEGNGKEFIRKNREAFSEILENAHNELNEIEHTPEFKEYSELEEKIRIGDASDENIKTAGRQKKELQEDIDLKQSLILKTKLKNRLGNQIEETVGKLPEEPITEQKLINLLNTEYQASKKELSEMEKSNELTDLTAKRNAAVLRADNKDAQKIKDKLDLAGAKLQKSEERLNLLNSFSERHKAQKAKTDKLVDIRNEVKESKKSIENVNHNKEIYDRLKSVKERFNQKSNGKMNVDCKNMMNQLEETMQLFDPSDENNMYKHDEQQKALDKLQELSGKYIEAKKGQHIPKLFASDQRLLRISCAEELQSFSQTAKSMVNDVKNMENSYGKAINYKTREADNSMKRRFDEQVIGRAANKTGLFQKFQTFLGQFNRRQQKTMVETKEDITLTND